MRHRNALVGAPVQRDQIVINAPALEHDADHTTLRFRIDGLEEGASLFFRVDRTFSDFLSQQADSAIAALLIPAMIVGKDIEIVGPASPRLVLNARKSVVPLLLKFLPGAQAIEIFADSLSAPAHIEQGRAVLTGLSNGIDSLATVSDQLLDQRTPPSERVTHFLFNSVGSHGHVTDKQTAVLFDERFHRVKAAADELDLPVIRTVSNLDVFYTTTKFQMSHTLRNAAVALTLQSGAKTLLYSASYEYGKVAARPSKDIATIEAILLPLLSSETLECRSVGSAYTRVQKTRLASDLELARRYLDICVVDKDNCSTCWKCARTLLTLELLGRLEDFADRFDLAAYGRIRTAFVAHVWSVRREDPYSEEVVDFMKEVGYRMTIRERVAGVALSVIYAAIRAIPLGVVRRLRQRFGGPMKESTLSQGITSDILWGVELAILSRLAPRRSRPAREATPRPP